MPENTKYCATCQQPIPTGKEIKIVDYLTSGSNYYNFSNRTIWDGGGYYSYPYAVYYLCPPCFRSYQRLQKKRLKKAIMVAIFIVIFVVLFILLLTLTIHLCLGHITTNSY